MLNVYITVDVEVWCDGWKNIDAKFPMCFKQYILGETAFGSYGVAFQAKLLSEHGLRGTFFVEPLFSLRFGRQWLDEAVSHVLQYDQDVQLHLHTEWIDEAREPPIPVDRGKRQFMRMFNEAEQELLLRLGSSLLTGSGASRPVCFRAGSFGFNHETLSALERVGIPMDASYNASFLGPSSGVAPGQILSDSLMIGGIREFPMTVFADGTGRLRHAQITACSWREMESLLWQALECDQRAFVILCHGSELLNRIRTRPDAIAVSRFEKLCRFLEQNADCFRTQTFDRDLPALHKSRQPVPLKSSIWRTGTRVMEQIWRRHQDFR